MVQVFKDLERTAHDVVRALALNMRHKADTAGIVFVGRVVQAVFLQMLDFGSRGHGALL